LAAVRVIALPVKSLAEAKTRLDPVLTPLERGALTLAMFEDVMDQVQRLSGWDVWVISPDEVVLEIGLARGVHAIGEERPTLRHAIAQVEEEAGAAGAETLAVLLADTPLVTTQALTRALHTLGPVVLAPSTDESGTNLLVRRPPTAVASRFGTDSYRKHLQAAAEADLPTAVVQIPELAFDVDLPGDILTVLEARKPGRTLEVCRDMDLAARLPSQG
jgi:2-phospho-L-lactate/phosphoenolpyruvate guanylyltransferase